eukprot:TRINITY_DN4679_c0_g1_i1.p1 TRINITY_DN4679_c0_g1~~TRINITY_DN4679_c0_g1_i1.p1  ORF type:complete len:213 (+),score=40.48 TRINITY_DN4679_c0_g1_i1:628-1266(+)
MRQAFQLRYSLIPYIATAAWDFHNEGLALVRPLYYEWPESSEAYTMKNEYMFGNDMLVNPITAPSDSNNISTQVMWFPPGWWVEFYSGEFFQGPATVTRQFMLDEIPVYVRAGAVLPMRVFNGQDLIGKAQETPTQLKLVGYVSGMEPGDSYTSKYYDDDGITTAYEQGYYCLTRVSLAMSSWTSVTLTINAYEGLGCTTPHCSFTFPRTLR